MIFSGRVLHLRVVVLVLSAASDCFWHGAASDAISFFIPKMLPSRLYSGQGWRLAIVVPGENELLAAAISDR